MQNSKIALIWCCYWAARVNEIPCICYQYTTRWHETNVDLPAKTLADFECPSGSILGCGTLRADVWDIRLYVRLQLFYRQRCTCFMQPLNTGGTFDSVKTTCPFADRTRVTNFFNGFMLNMIVVKWCLIQACYMRTTVLCGRIYMLHRPLRGR